MDKLRVVFQDWGRISYKEAWDRQTTLHNELKNRKLRNRRSVGEEVQNHYLIFCEHHPVYTLGKSGSVDHLLLSEDQLAQQKIEYYKINRGGDITYHGPGQIVAYPIFDLDEMFTDVHRYVRYLEEVIIKVIGYYGLDGIRIKDYTGVWLPEDASQKNRKICAIGVHLSRWVTMHGLAFNVNTDLNYFRHIIPCGIDDKDKEVCSLRSELGYTLDYEKVKKEVRKTFEEIFNIDTYEGREICE